MRKLLACLAVLVAIVALARARAKHSGARATTRYVGQLEQKGRWGIGSFRFTRTVAESRRYTFEIPKNCESDEGRRPALRIAIDGDPIYADDPCGPVAFEVPAGASLEATLSGRCCYYALEVTED